MTHHLCIKSHVEISFLTSCLYNSKSWTSFLIYCIYILLTFWTRNMKFGNETQFIVYAKLFVLWFAFPYGLWHPHQFLYYSRSISIKLFFINYYPKVIDFVCRSYLNYHTWPFWNSYIILKNTIINNTVIYNDEYSGKLIVLKGLYFIYPCHTYKLDNDFNDLELKKKKKAILRTQYKPTLWIYYVICWKK